MSDVLIGTVAEITGVSTQTIRFYERRGLLRPADRLGNGYRHYDGATIGRVAFIHSAQASGLTLAEIHSIIGMREAEQTPCAHVTHLLVEKLVGMRERQRQLERLAAELEGLIEQGELLDPEDCSGAEVCHILAKPQPSSNESPQ